MIAAYIPSSEEADAAVAAAMEERLNTEGVLRLSLRKAMGLLAADLNGKSDPYIVLQVSERGDDGALVTKHMFRSTVKPKTLNPVWNEDFEVRYRLDGSLDLRAHTSKTHVLITTPIGTWHPHRVHHVPRGYQSLRLRQPAEARKGRAAR